MLVLANSDFAVSLSSKSSAFQSGDRVVGRFSKNSGPFHQRQLETRSLSERPLVPKSAGLARPLTWCHCPGRENCRIEETLFFTKSLRGLLDFIQQITSIESLQ